MVDYSMKLRIFFVEFPALICIIVKRFTKVVLYN